MSILDQVCDNNPLMFLTVAIGVLCALVAVLIVVIIWPLTPKKSRIDVMSEPFGDQPRVPS